MFQSSDHGLGPGMKFPPSSIDSHELSTRLDDGVQIRNGWIKPQSPSKHTAFHVHWKSAGSILDGWKCDDLYIPVIITQGMLTSLNKRNKVLTIVYITHILLCYIFSCNKMK